MLVFLDFEASSLGKNGYPIEVGWVFEDGSEEGHLIRPAADWSDWDEGAAAVHGISREQLEREGEAHEVVARRMIDVLSGHDLLASAPSWDGKWLSRLLRAAGLPRHSLRLRDSDDAIRQAARAALSTSLSGDALEQRVDQLIAQTDVQTSDSKPAHRALADAQAERQLWLAVKSAAGA